MWPLPEGWPRAASATFAGSDDQILVCVHEASAFDVNADVGRFGVVLCGRDGVVRREWRSCFDDPDFEDFIEELKRARSEDPIE